MNAKNQYIVEVCKDLEERALALLYDDERYGKVPVDVRTELYDGMRKSVVRVSESVPKLRKRIVELIREYDEYGAVEGHKLCDRFHTGSLVKLAQTG